MARKTKKYLLISLIVLAIFGFAAAFVLYNKGPRDVKNISGIKVKAIDLYSLYSFDSLQAKKMYTDKIVEVTGIVKEISVNAQQQKIILFKTNTSSASVNCTLDDSAENPAISAAITLKGICSGMGQGDPEMGIMGDVYLSNCYILNK